MSNIYFYDLILYLKSFSFFLVTKKHVLTAAHCIQDKFKSPPVLPNECYFLLGKSNLKINEPGSTNSSVSNLISHPDWNPWAPESEADIAIAVLTEPVVYSNFIGSICLYRDKFERLHNKKATVCGWGTTRQHLIQGSDIAYETSVRITNPVDCLLEHRDLIHLFGRTSFCVMNQNGTGACHGETIQHFHIYLSMYHYLISGDSGGALFLKEEGKYYATGIVSASLLTDANQCDIEKPQIYTEVGIFYNWIVMTVESTQ